MLASFISLTRKCFRLKAYIGSFTTFFFSITQALISLQFALFSSKGNSVNNGSPAFTPNKIRLIAPKYQPLKIHEGLRPVIVLRYLTDCKRVPLTRLFESNIL